MNLPYYLIIGFLFFLWIITKNSKNRTSSSKCFFIGALAVVLFDVLKEPLIYPDNSGYKNFFFYEDFLSYISTDGVNIGYRTFNNTCRYIFGNFTVFSMIVAMITTIPYFSFAKRHSTDIMLSLLLFVLTNYLISFWVWRQYIATVIVLYAYNHVIKKKLKKYCLLMLLAASFHTTAIVAFPIYFLYHFRWTRFCVFVSILALVVAYFVSRIIISYILSYSAFYAAVLDVEAESTLGRFALKTFWLMLYVFTLQEKSYSKNINRLVLFCGIMSVILYGIGNGIYGLYRLRSYFEVSEIIGIPLIISNLKYNNLSKKFLIRLGLIIYILALLYTTYSFIESENFLYGYKTIFEDFKP